MSDGICRSTPSNWAEAELAAAERRIAAEDVVNHPPHYTHGRFETIDVIEDWQLGFCLGNAVKYISRAGHKDPARTVEDLKKARWYLDRHIAKLEGPPALDLRVKNLLVAEPGADAAEVVEQPQPPRPVASPKPRIVADEPRAGHVRVRTIERDPKPEKVAAPAPVPSTTSTGKPRQRAVMRCRKCGAPGFRADGCGTSHAPLNDSGKEGSSHGAAGPVRSAATPDRLAAIRKAAGELPAPRSSFVVNNGDVRELDFGGEG